MKKFKTVLFASLLFLITSNGYAQQANVSDFIANWSGTGSDGNSYLLTLNEDNSASMKNGNATLDIVWWKLNFADGSIVYDKNDHATMRLITNVTTTGTQANQLTLSANSGTNQKTYYADVVYDINTNTLTLVVDFGNSPGGSAATPPVTIVFNK